MNDYQESPKTTLAIGGVGGLGGHHLRPPGPLSGEGGGALDADLADDPLDGGALAVVSALVVHLAGALDRVGLQLLLAAAGPAW
ncbi:hypothetical protein [Streptosporangium canum]|uniref:hypothetical protein n=1 Tax=Streptosporangium canum TaxID=324952 RepID=UPI00378B640D